MTQLEKQKVWSVAEAKARLSEVLRLASEEGPQRIGIETPYVIVPEAVWLKLQKPPVHIGRWLLENMPRIDDLELPSRHEPEAPPLFDHEDWDENSELSR